MSFRASELAVRCRAGSAINKGVLLVLAEAADADGVCWLSQATIAERSECPPRAAYSALAQLTQAGLIGRRRRVDSRGHRTSDLITLTIGQVAKDASRGEPQTAQDAGRDEGPTRTSCTAYSHLVPSLLAPGAKEPVNEPVSEPVSESPPTPQPLAELFRLEASEETLSVSEAFERWWATYPRKVAKEAARRAFGTILKDKRATFAQLMDGAAAYAASRAGQDPRYTAHPATWLRGGRWADEPTPVPLPAPTRPREPWSALDQAVAGLIGDDDEPLTGRAA
jgi:Helix-turn-helix domain